MYPPSSAELYSAPGMAVDKFVYLLLLTSGEGEETAAVSPHYDGAFGVPLESDIRQSFKFDAFQKKAMGGRKDTEFGH